MVAMSSLAGCTINPGTTTAHTPRTPNCSNGCTKIVLVSKPGLPVLYSFGTVNFDTAEEALAALRDTEATELATIRPVKGAVPYGSIRVVLPTRPLQWPASKTANIPNNEMEALSQSLAVTRQNLIASLQKSGHFSRVTVEFSDDPIPAPLNADYVLWPEGDNWFLGRLGRNPVNFSASASNIGFWLALASDAVARLNSASLHEVGFHLSADGQHATLLYEGAPYEDLITLNDAVARDNAQQLALVKPVSNRLGGNALIILTDHSAHKPFGMRLLDSMYVAGLARPGQNGLPSIAASDLITTAANGALLSTSQARAAAVGMSRLFDHVTVETVPVTDVPTTGYDYVLYEMTGKPGPWRLHAASGGGDVILTWPKGSSTFQQDVGSIGDQIRASQRAPVVK